MNKKDISSPIARKIEKKMVVHDDIRIDNYYWLNDRDNPDVISYLKQENDYTKTILQHTEALQNELYSEIVGRIKKTDMSVPFKRKGYYYSSRFEEGKEYPIYSRKKGSLDAKEEIILDVNVLAKDYDYYAINGNNVSPNNSLLAFGEDTISRRIYTIRFKNIETGKFLNDKIPNTTGSVAWGNDNKTVFYTVKDETLRGYKIFRHTLGTAYENDVELYHEKDVTFGCFVYKTKSEDYIVIGSYSTLSSEYRILDANAPTGNFKVFQERAPEHEYDIYHDGKKFYIRTNIEAKNFKLMKCPNNLTSMDNWEEVIEHRNDVLLQSIDVFKNYMVISERIKGLTQIQIRSKSNEEHYLEFDDQAYVATTARNPEFETEILRYEFSSLTTPNSTFDYNMKSKKKERLKIQEVVGDFDSSNYNSERVLAIANDGTEIPISLVYKKDIHLDGTAPILLYGYGSYGHSIDPYFSSVRLSLLDRGFVYAIAHIRGGQEMGRSWYEGGKLLKKKNTFTDFICCGEHLVAKQYGSKELLFGYGGSAGGLLIGAVINMKPNIWAGAVAAVPFVDVVTTMLDETIPLTTGEYDEWGNPNEKEYYEYIKSYSPYDNIESKDYPALLVTTGLHDSQVQYWEPAKWVAKLRDLKTNDKPLLLHTDMETGHGGASGRFKRFKETALTYSFLIDVAKGIIPQ